MSGSDDRWHDVTNRQVSEVLDAARRAQLDAERAMARLDQQLAQAKYEWRLRQASPRPGQPHDSWIVEQKRDFTKASMAMDGLFCRLTRVTRHGRVLLIEATGACPAGETSRVRGALHAVLRKNASAPALAQMHNPGIGPAGSVTEAAVTASGKVIIRAIVTDRVAAAKTTEQIYPGLSVKLDDDGVSEISLVDRDPEVSKGSSSDLILAKIYKRGQAEMANANISKARQDAILAIQMAEQALAAQKAAAGGDVRAAQANLDRVCQQAQLVLIREGVRPVRPAWAGW